MGLTILKALKPTMPSLKHEIHKRLAGWEEPRPHFPLRASDLLKKDAEFCPREHAFMDLGLAKKKGSFVGTSLRMTFNHGNFMERQIRNVYLRDLAVGNWECGVCKKVHPTFGKAPKVNCHHCGWDRWEYMEPRFADVGSGVSGGIDVLLDVGQPKLLITEVKTMTPEDFKTLVAPLAEHKFRTALYLMLAESSTWEASNRVNVNEAKVLYVTKSFGFKDESLKAAGIKDAAFSPFKEFTIKRDDSLLATPMGKATVLKKWRDDKKLGMPCGICTNGLTKRAQGCPAVSACWSGKYQSTLTWLEQGAPRHPGKKLLT